MLSRPVLYAIHTGSLPRGYFLCVLRSPLPFCTDIAGGCFQFLCCHMVVVHVSHLVSYEWMFQGEKQGEEERTLK
jgi:hypothetical protein